MLLNYSIDVSKNVSFVQAILHFILLLFRDMRMYSYYFVFYSVNECLCMKTALAVALKNFGKNNDSC